MENLTKVILENTNKNMNANVRRIIAFGASFFSVIFALSIVHELTTLVNGFVLTFLTIFVVIFLLLVEKYKVKSIRAIYKGNKKAILPFVITFFISASLSSIGIYLWTNKSFDRKLENDSNKISQELLIKNKYQDQINQVEKEKFTGSELDLELKESVTYWKSRKASDIKDRSYIRTQIEYAEEKHYQARQQFENNIETEVNRLTELMNVELSQLATTVSNTDKTIDYQNKISYIFFLMILITELGIVILNKEMAEMEVKLKDFAESANAKKFLLARNVLVSLYLTKDKEDKTNMMHALYSAPVQKMGGDDSTKWNAVKNLYNHFINLGILDEGELKKTKAKKQILINKIIVSEDEALRIFDGYYNKLLSL